MSFGSDLYKKAVKFAAYVGGTTAILAGLGTAGIYFGVDYFPRSLKPVEVAVIDNFVQGYSRKLFPGDPIRNWRLWFENKHIVNTRERELNIGVRPIEGTEGQKTTKYDRKGYLHESLMLTGPSGSGEFAIADGALSVVWKPDREHIEDYVYNNVHQYTREDLETSLNKDAMDALKKVDEQKYLRLRDIKQFALLHNSDDPKEKITLDEALRSATYDFLIREATKVAFKAVTGDTSFQGMIAEQRKEIADKTHRALLHVDDETGVYTGILSNYGRTPEHTFGVEIVSVNLRHADPPGKISFKIDGEDQMVNVRGAYAAVQSAKGDRDAIINEAWQDYYPAVNKAEGEAQQFILGRQGESEKVMKQADADVVEFQRVRESIDEFPGNKAIAYETVRLEGIELLLKSMESKTLIPEQAVPLFPFDKLKK